MLSEGRVARVAVVAPTTHIARQWAADAARYGIDLEPNRPNADGPEPRDRQGIAATYQTVAAGPGVAFAWALLRCGSADELAAHPDRRLRLTIGLRKVGERWTVTHEHHSFPDRG